MNGFTANIVASVVAGIIILVIEYIIFQSLSRYIDLPNQKWFSIKTLRSTLIYIFIFWSGTQLHPLITRLTQRPNVIIASHITGDIIPQSITISGIYSNLDSDQTILVYVHSDNYALGQVKELSNGLWRTNMTIGGKEENGKKFKIGTVVMTKSDAQLLEQTNYKSPYLPEGSIEQLEIVLTREN